MIKYVYLQGGVIMLDMIDENDKTIFNYLNPNYNEIISKIKDNDLKEILGYLDKYYLEYRNLLEFSSNITFGIEIEFENFRVLPKDYWSFQHELNKIVGNDTWISKHDSTLNKGREIASDILTDDVKTWDNIKNVCDFCSFYGEIGVNCGGHIHLGSQILGENSLYWYRFFKLWSVYENVIYRFSYGEYLTCRPNIDYHAKPAAVFFDSSLPTVEDKLDFGLYRLLVAIRCANIPVDRLRSYGVSYCRMLADDNYDLYEDYNKINDGCTIEFRAPNGTFDQIIWQNNINFFVHLMLYCKSDKFNDDILDIRRLKVKDLFCNLDDYAKIYLEEAIELCDLIFNKNIDKIYFLRQYLKSFEVADKPFIKAKKFTMNNVYV